MHCSLEDVDYWYHSAGWYNHVVIIIDNIYSVVNVGGLQVTKVFHRTSARVLELDLLAKRGIKFATKVPRETGKFRERLLTYGRR